MKSSFTNCVKCGQTVKKNRPCLSGYKPKENLCPNCNAVRFISERLANGQDISLEEMKKLPKYIVFDANDSNPLEAAMGIRFVELQKKYT